MVIRRATSYFINTNYYFTGLMFDATASFSSSFILAGKFDYVKTKYNYHLSTVSSVLILISTHFRGFFTFNSVSIYCPEHAVTALVQYP